MESQSTKDLIVTLVNFSSSSLYLHILRSNFDEIINEILFGALSNEIETVWNIGGTEIYRLALDRDMIDRLIVTKIDKRYVSLLYSIFCQV